MILSGTYQQGAMTDALGYKALLLARNAYNVVPPVYAHWSPCSTIAMRSLHVESLALH